MLRPRLLALPAVALAAGLTGVGCASYETYPAAPDSAPYSMSDPNHIATRQVIGASLRWVATKYPPSGEPVEAAAVRNPPAPFAVNLPPGTSYMTYTRVIDMIGMGARPI